jgi:hypothetical protein
MYGAIMNQYLSQILELSNKSKYAYIYVQLCESRLTRITQTEYTEKHHMLPKSFKLGGERDMSNVIRFTFREHFIAHRLLSKMFSNKRMKSQMLKAITAFYQKTKFQQRNPNSRQFAIMKAAARESNILINTGRKSSAETKLKQSINNGSRNPLVKAKIAKTKTEKYGVAGYCNPTQTKSTKLEKYGSETFVNSNQASQTKLEKYGTTTYNNWDKTKSTNLEKYGSSNKANMPVTCEFCSKQTIFSWYVRKHKDGKCLKLDDYVPANELQEIPSDLPKSFDLT